MRLFLTILIVVAVFAAGWAFGYTDAKIYVMRDFVTPLCMIMYGAIDGKHAEDFCNSIIETERGENVARLFYIFYEAGHRMDRDEDKKKCFEYSLKNWKLTRENLDIWISRNTSTWRKF